METTKSNAVCGSYVLFVLQYKEVQAAISFDLKNDRLSGLQLVELRTEHFNAGDGMTIDGVNDVTLPQCVAKIWRRASKGGDKNAVIDTERDDLANSVIDSDA